MSDNIYSIKDKIHKLLDLTDIDAAADGEIDNALRFAEMMFAKHNLTRDDVTTTNSDSENPEIDISKVVFDRQRTWSLTSKSSVWEHWLLTLIPHIFRSVDAARYRKAKPMRRNGILFLDQNRKLLYQVPLLFYGPEVDVAAAVDLFEELQQIIASMARLRRGDCFNGNGAAYCEDFVYALLHKHQRLSLEMRESTTDPTTALMLARSDQTSLALRKAGKSWFEKTLNVRIP